MPYTDDPIKDAMRYLQEQEEKEREWIDSLPKCAHCKEPIQDRLYFVIEDENICRDCLVEYCEEHYEQRNDDAVWR